MDQSKIITDEKKKSDWQLFTNDGKFDSKLPPSQRIHRTKDFKLLVLTVFKPKPPKPVKDEKPQPQVDCVENFILVWLDQSMGKIKDMQTSKKQLQQVVNSVKIFTDPKECQAFLSTIKDEQIFVILSGIVEEGFVSSIHNSKQLESIYVFSPNEKKEESWFSEYPEIRGIYTSILSLCGQLSKDVKMIDRCLLGLVLIERSLSNNRSTTSQQEALFMYDQLFRDIVLAVPDVNMQDMYEFCEKKYYGRPQEQAFLKAFKQNYDSQTPVWWYSNESFLYRMLNKALRTHQYDTLYLLRVFIRQLHEQIVALQKEQSIGPKVLFRGQGMDKEDFERLRASKGGLLSVSNFLSTSSNREIGLQFACDALRDKKKVSILMEIKVENNTGIPVASITDSSADKTEQEWLFSMGSVFRIGSVERLPEGIWLVPLTLTNDQDKQLDALKAHFKKSMTDSNTCVNFANLMHRLAAWKKSEYFYLMALQTETTSYRRAVLYNDLGMIKEELEQYDESLDYYQKSLALKEKEGSDTVSDKATTYNNIGALYHKQKKMDQAIEYFQKAIEACNVQGNKNEELMATLHGNISAILEDQGKYEEALEKCMESLKIRSKIFPTIHPDIASTYSTMASIMHSMKLHARAIEYAQKALDIDRQALPPDHPQTLNHMHHLEIYKQHQPSD